MKQAMSSKPINRPIFIIGVGRSGTTLLQAMLHAHKHIAFTPETHFVRRYLARRHMHRMLERGDGDRFLELIRKDNDLNRLEFDFAEIVSQLKQAGNLSLPSFYRYLLERWRDQKQAVFVGDKDPKNIEYLRLINDYFPEAYIIHIIRDPRAVVLSRMKAEWSRHRSFLSQVAIYHLQLRKGRREGPALFGKQYYEIMYEDLVTDPAAECRRLCQWLNLPFDPRMLDFQETSHEIIKGREINWKEDCFKPVQAANKDKWSGQLKRKQICIIEAINSDVFNQFGFRKSGYLEDRTLWAGIARQLLRLAMWKLGIAYRLFHWLRYRSNRTCKQ